MEWDYTVFKYINDLANDQSFFGKLVVTAADRGDIFFFLSLVVIMLFHRKMGIYGFIAAGFSVAFSRSFSLLYYRDRPFVTHEVNQLLPHIESNSFPSDHAVAAFTIAIMIFLFSRWLGSAYIVFASIVSFSRIWVGKHYPLDIVVGVLMGISLAIVIYYFLEKTGWYDKLLYKLKTFHRKRPEGLDV